MNKYILTAACGLAFSAASAQTKALPDSPNILLILVDDLGYGDLSCQGAAKDIQTPHIDKLLGNYILLCTISKTIKGHMIMYPFIIQSFFSFFFPFPSFLTLQERVFRKRGSRGSIFGL